MPVPEPLARPQYQVAGSEVRVRAAIKRDHGVVGNQVADGFDHHLRPQGRTRGRLDFCQAVPVRHAALRFLQKAAVRLPLEEGDQCR
jgi:hypothetical protein